MTKEQFAQMITGRSRRDDLNKIEQDIAKQAGLVVVHGGSDDLMEFRGAIYDEAGCYEGGDVLFTKEGKIIGSDVLEKIEELEEELGFRLPPMPLNKIEAIWAAEGEPTWTYKTDIPHANFGWKEDDEEDGMYCRGIVFSITDLK